MIQNTTAWKVRKLKVGHVVSFHDVANAFPSPTHTCMDQMITECAPPEDSRLLKGRYGQAIIHIRAHDGRTVTVRPRVWGLQGDSCMARMFSDEYDKGIDQWNDSHEKEPSGKLLMATHPAKEWYWPVARLIFGDDIAEINLATNKEGVTEVSMDRNEKLDAARGPGRTPHLLYESRGSHSI